MNMCHDNLYDLFMHIFLECFCIILIANSNIDHKTLLTEQKLVLDRKNMTCISFLGQYQTSPFKYLYLFQSELMLNSLLNLYHKRIQVNIYFNWFFGPSNWSDCSGHGIVSATYGFYARTLIMTEVSMFFCFHLDFASSVGSYSRKY